MLQKAIGPVEQSVYMSAHRIATCDALCRKAAKELAKNDEGRRLPRSAGSCHEADAMVLSAEMQFRAADMRKESQRMVFARGLSGNGQRQLAQMDHR